MKLFFVLLFSFFINTSLFSLTLHQEIFKEEYFNPINEQTCPPSLELKHQLFDVFNSLRIEHVIDAGCGNFDLLLPEKISYLGLDVVENIVRRNHSWHAEEKKSFRNLDITQELLPQTDLILCRDCLTYFSYHDIYIALENFKKSNSQYLCMTTHPFQQDNDKRKTGYKRKINFSAHPFYFPQPSYYIKDGDEGECLGLWILDEIDLSFFKSFLFPQITIFSSEQDKETLDSIQRGFNLIHANLNINTWDVLENVIILSDFSTFLHGYDLKLKSKIGSLWVGPEMLNSKAFLDSNGFFSLVDGCLTYSEWQERNITRFHPSLSEKLNRWLIDINESEWRPKQRFLEKPHNKNCLLYRKSNFDLCDQVQRLLEKNGFKVFTINHGEYKPEQYRDLLNICNFAVFVSRYEFQEKALAQAWSMDVPTIVWNHGGTMEYSGYIWDHLSGCPTLNPSLGCEWKNLPKLQELIQNFDSMKYSFQPRRWVLLNMTDKVSAERIIGLEYE